MNVHNVDMSNRASENSGSVIKAWLRALEMTKPIGEQPKRLLPDLIDAVAQTFPDATALISERECMTFRELVERSNRYARWALAQGLAPGEVVGLLMPNRPEYMAIWLGVTRVGGVVALLNTNLVGPSLAHCINIVAPAHIIVAEELFEAFASARAHLASSGEIWSHGGGDVNAFRNIAHDVGRRTGEPLTPDERRPLTIADRALYIFTSGTTGLPKAAKVSHQRLLTWSCWFAGMMDTQPSDRMYNCLPMYHSIGGVVATGAVLINGGSVVIREKFSARQFWDDITRFDCTLFQYIGELCRYLVRGEPHARERSHRLRLCCGNGLRADVWDEFKSRFQIPRILEFYAATEGNVTMFNVEGKPGAIGRTPSFLAHRSPTALVTFDVERGEPLRNPQGHCIRCQPGEVGEAIGKILKAGANLGGHFEGYTSQADSEKKVLRDVFETGDAWFRTGDLMRKDDNGYFHFVDRIGDTFRWKGENVSTSEVAEVFTAFPGISEATVYGVAVPRAEGRAGMVTIVSECEPDLAALHDHLTAQLPGYACPLFLRLRREIEITSTFKHRKNDLVHAGYNPSIVSDPIFFRDPRRRTFVRLDEALHARIKSGEVRL